MIRRGEAAEFCAQCDDTRETYGELRTRVDELTATISDLNSQLARVRNERDRLIMERRWGA